MRAAKSLVIVAGVLLPMLAAAQPAPVSTTELKGKVARVRITPGEGMPFVEVRTGDQTAIVRLGSMRYLMTQGFNPKVGEDISAKVVKVGTDYIAITVTVGDKTVRLRDEYGRPLWRGGPPWRMR